ncbi:Hypothetical predicted protein [Octopus vulgaris]|uniref:Uncharacterized protein n=1 Tax=Octopus vulgaris TaxID=6645 RepID=A0AA36C1F3_OCTVU|nr:Hypothetical predicted protein [Octopus vulgaris]
MFEKFFLEINQTGSFGEMYLIAACKPGNTVVINWLIDAGTDLDTRDIFGHTALHYYVIGRIHKIPMVTHFCPLGNSGNTPLHFAVLKSVPSGRPIHKYNTYGSSMERTFECGHTACKERGWELNRCRLCKNPTVKKKIVVGR